MLIGLNFIRYAFALLITFSEKETVDSQISKFLKETLKMNGLMICLIQLKNEIGGNLHLQEINYCFHMRSAILTRYYLVLGFHLVLLPYCQVNWVLDEKITWRILT